MRAARIHRFGAPEVIDVDEVARPAPGPHEVLVRVGAAGVGPWDALVRRGVSVLAQPLPLTLGAELSGTVEARGAEVRGIAVGDPVFGATNARFTGAYAEYALAHAARIAPRPRTLDDVAAAALPVAAVTAWQMLFEAAKLRAGQRVLVLGAAGSVGGFAVALAKRAGARILGTASTHDLDAVRRLGADEAIDRATPLHGRVRGVDVVIDTVGGEAQKHALALLGEGGTLVSAVAVSKPDAAAAERRGVRASFLLVRVMTAELERIGRLVDGGELTVRVGTVLPLGAAREAHEILEKKRPRPRGKIVLQVGSPARSA